MFQDDPFFGAFFGGQAMMQSQLRLSFMDAVKGTKRQVRCRSF